MFVTRQEHNASQVFAVIAPWLYITLRNTHLRPTLNLYPHWVPALRSQVWIRFQLLKGNSSFGRKIDLGQFCHFLVCCFVFFFLFLSKIGGRAENMYSQVSQHGINQSRHITFSKPRSPKQPEILQLSSSHSYSPDQGFSSPHVQDRALNPSFLEKLAASHSHHQVQPCLLPRIFLNIPQNDLSDLETTTTTLAAPDKVRISNVRERQGELGRQFP